ncbi:Exopolyphosphatase PRUNE1 [Pseudolycoriella hygida]|uniref:Exopolyphosphatase PRUNE1 n=1 Tax=Pseudolycoriella hygida TaxID=35572 RepID=A0A9Q0RV92_9DIPT|nr:Exopolyphosphatase PRUNE1 [Pseudolycoriella hygida]
MNKFLLEARKWLTLKEPLCIVLGNDSCDLDSACCALCLAFFYNKHRQSIADLVRVETPIIPVLNTSRTNLPLKTEVTYFLRKNDILQENVICSDEVPTSVLDASKFILVDHHVSPFNKQTIQVIDHRPFYSGSNLPTDCRLNIQEVGSCATLVADLIFKSNVDTKSDDLLETLKMLYAPIVLDTVNFSKDADKAKPLDKSISDKLESILDIDEESRVHLFNELVEARADVSSLDSLQILSKDMKIFSNFDGTRVIAIPGFPISSIAYTQMLNAKENLLKFADTHGCDVIVLMGMKVVNGIVSRDLGVVNIKDLRLFDKIIERIADENSMLSLVPNENNNFLNGKFYDQKNVKASRKQILPMVKKVLDEFYGNGP